MKTVYLEWTSSIGSGSSERESTGRLEANDRRPAPLCADMRLRTASDRLKIEHSIIDGLRPVLERLLTATPEIRSIVPGVIRRVRDAKGEVKMHVTVPVQNGWKGIALAAGARQELFISTTLDQKALERAMEKALK